jgi:DNA-binding transcriptional regulator GbsR (MarR family)
VPRNRTAARDPVEVRHFIERLSLLLVDMGLPPMPARVWATCMSADEDALTPGDLAQRLGVSPAAISGAVRYLLQVGLLERVPIPGSRRQHYRVPTGLWYEAFMHREQALKAFSAVAAEGIKTLGARSPAGARMAEIRDFFEFLADALPKLLSDWRAQSEAESARSLTR